MVINPCEIPRIDSILYNQGLRPLLVPDRDTWRHCFANLQANWQPEMVGDSADNTGLVSYRPAAVLILLIHANETNGPVQQEDVLTVLLTKRTMNMQHHAGQISFPGGRVDEQDPHVIHTALREAHEEVSLDPDVVEVLGVMPPYRTGTGYVISPVVGLAESPLELNPNPAEVAEIFQVPLSFIFDPVHHHKHRYVREGGVQRDFYAIPWGDYFIWGATAAMLRNLYCLMYTQSR